MPFESLREFVGALDEMGELRKVEGADWNLEIGALTELIWEAGGPAPLFQDIKGYPTSAKIATNLFATRRRCFIALDMPEELTEQEGIEKFESQLADCKPIPPRVVSSGPVVDHCRVDGDVDLFKFPVPQWHELDGGRYIGTGCCVIQRDPDGGWVNVGTYRVMAHDRNTAGIYIGENHQGANIEKLYWKRGNSCPVAVSLGPDPIFFLVSSGGFNFPWGVSEYDVAGHLHGRPVEVIVDPYTQLPIPAHSEVVLVGEIPPPEVECRPEGPFGEFTGYYASGTRPEPVIRVKAIYHRHDPILLGSPPLKPKGPYGYSFALSVKKRNIKRELAAKGISDVLDDCTLSIPGVEVIKMQQRRPGHALEVGLEAVKVSGARIVIVVDEDVDVRNPMEVLWALGTRCDLENGVNAVKNCRTYLLDPGLSPEKREKGDLTTTKLVIDACRPYSWAEAFPPVNRCSQDRRLEAVKKWRDLFRGLEVKA